MNDCSGDIIDTANGGGLPRALMCVSHLLIGVGVAFAAILGLGVWVALL